jgi:hypothetical protein
MWKIKPIFMWKIKPIVMWKIKPIVMWKIILNMICDNNTSRIHMIYQPLKVHAKLFL